MTRDQQARIWLRFTQLGVVVFFMDGYAPTLQFLAGDLRISVAQAAFHSTAYGLGLIAGSLSSNALAPRMRTATTLTVGFAGIVIGAGLFVVSPHMIGTLAGIFIAGAFSAITQACIYADLAESAPGRQAKILSEAPAVSQVAGMLAPVVIGIAAATVLGWRAGIGLTILFGAVFSLVEIGRYRRRDRSAPSTAQIRLSSRPEVTRLRAKFWLMWASMITVLGIELSLAVWAPVWMRAHTPASVSRPSSRSRSAC